MSIQKNATCRVSSDDVDKISLTLKQVLEVGSARVAQLRPPTKPKMGIIKKPPRLRDPNSDLKDKLKQVAREESQIMVSPEQEAKLVVATFTFIDQIPFLYTEDNGELLSLACAMAVSVMLVEAGLITDSLNAEFQNASQEFIGQMGLDAELSGAGGMEQMDISAIFTEDQKMDLRRKAFETTSVMDWMLEYVSEMGQFVQAVQAKDWKQASIIAGKFILFNFVLPKIAETGVAGLMSNLNLPGYASYRQVVGIANTSSREIADKAVDITKDAAKTSAGKIGGYFSNAFRKVGNLDPSLFDPPKSVTLSNKAKIAKVVSNYALGAVGPLPRMLAYVAAVTAYATYRCGTDSMKSIEGFLAANSPDSIDNFVSKLRQSKIKLQQPSKPQSPGSKPTPPKNPTQVKPPSRPRIPIEPKDPGDPPPQPPRPALNATPKQIAKYETDLAKWRTSTANHALKQREYAAKMAEYNERKDEYDAQMVQYRALYELYEARLQRLNSDLATYSQRMNEYEQKIEEYNRYKGSYEQQVAQYKADQAEFAESLAAFNDLMETKKKTFRAAYQELKYLVNYKGTYDAENQTTTTELGIVGKYSALSGNVFYAKMLKNWSKIQQLKQYIQDVFAVLNELEAQFPIDNAMGGSRLEEAAVRVQQRRT